MITLLPTLSSQNSADSDWQAFLDRRGQLVQNMRLDVCDGCDGCGGRCTAGFLVTREEWESANAYLATVPPAEVHRVLTQNKNVPWPGAEDSGATVTLCRFRDTEKDNCFLYPARPTICRLFGQTAWLPCPIDAVPSYPSDAPAVWNAYRRFERRTWEDWDAALAP